MKKEEYVPMPELHPDDVVDELSRTAEGRHLLYHAVMFDDVCAVISNTEGVRQETKEQVLASLEHISGPGEAMSYYAFCMHMAEVRGVVPDQKGFDIILKAMSDAGDAMPITEPPEYFH